MSENKSLFTTQIKMKIASEVIYGKQTVEEIARKHGVLPEEILKWRDAMLEMFALVLGEEGTKMEKEKIIAFLNNKDMDYKKYVYGKAVLDNTQNIIKVIDIDSYKVLYLNVVAKKVYGLKKNQDYLNVKCYELFFEKQKVCEFCPNERLREKGVYQWNMSVGEEGHLFAHTGHLLEIDGKNAKIEIGIDIEEHRSQLQALDSKINLDQTLFKCITILTETEDLQQAIEKTLAIVCEYYDGDRGYIFEKNEDGTLLNNTYEWCREGISPEIENLQNVPVESSTHWFESFEEKGYHFISNLYDDSYRKNADYKILAAQGIYRLMTVPLIENGKMNGFFGIDNPRNHVDDFSLLSSSGYFVMNDIQKRRMYTKMEHQSCVDILTELHNRNKCNIDISKLENKPPQSIGIVYIDLNGLKEANDQIGHAYGDRLLIHLANAMRKAFEKNVYRVGGDEFVVLCVDITKEEFEKKVEKFYELRDSQDIFSAAVGTVWKDKTIHIREEIKQADKLMYADKQRYYKRKKVMSGGYYSKV